MVIFLLRYVFPLCLAAWLAACAAGQDQSRPDVVVIQPDAAPPVKRELRVWAEDHPLLRPFDVVLDGCRNWFIGDIDCLLVAENEADIRIRAATPDELAPDADPERVRIVNCMPDAEGKYLLAVSMGQGNVEFYPVCYARGFDAAGLVIYDTLVATTTVAHEIGHELGIPHVERSCAGVVITDGQGRKLCGQAVMNPYLDLWSAPALTEVDEVAYDMFVKNVILPPAVQGCVYLAVP